MIQNFLTTPLLVILGHYGSGKTNFALNLAIMLKQEGRHPTLVDLDVVNPYFRSTDYGESIEEQDIKITGPVFGNSTLDAPSLSPAIDAAIMDASLERPVILDVGGDPDGARALSRYAPAIRKRGDALVVAVLNLRRPETQTLKENLRMLNALACQSSLAIGGLVGNTHLAEFTTEKIVYDSLPLLREISLASEVPLIAVTYPEKLLPDGEELLRKALSQVPALYDEDETALDNPQSKICLIPIKHLVKTVWQ